MYRTTPAPIAALIAGIGLLALLAIGCSTSGVLPPERFTTVSLFNQLDPAEPPGPWRSSALPGVDPAWFAEAEGLAVVRDGVKRPAAELAGEELDTIRALIRSGGLIQTGELSTLSLPVKLLAGERVVCLIRYPGLKTGQEPDGVGIRLLSHGEKRTALPLRGEDKENGVWPLDGRHTDGHQSTMVVPEGGKDRLDIIHRRKPGTPLKLLSIDVLVVDADAPQCEVARAQFFLHYGSSGTSRLFSGAAVRRLVRVSRYGMTARCAVLAPGDSLEYSLYPGGVGGRLAFNSLRPSGDKDADARLDLEYETGGGWVRVTGWKREHLPAGEWGSVTADLDRLPGNTGRIRLTHAGREGAIGIAEPVILPPAGLSSDRPNLVLVALDTLRADRLGCYGYRERPTSQRLDRTLEEWGGALFRRAHSASPWTIPATAKFMSSRYLDFHGVRQIPQSTTMLAEFLQDRGYFCTAFTGGGMVAVPGMEQGFHEYRWSSGFGKVEGSFPQAGQWLRQWDGGPFFLFVHTYETHRPYTRDTFCRGLPRGRLGDLSAGEPLFNREVNTVTPCTIEERAYVQAAYDSGVFHACEATADLLDILDETGKRSDTVVVILSDHGEELWDRHALVGAHGHSLHREMLEVPLIIHGPETAGRGLTVLEEPVSTVDLPPTVADLLGLSWESGADGVSLRPLIVGGEIHRTIPILADLGRSPIHPEISPQACVIEDGIKYIEPLAPGTSVRAGPLSGVVPPTVPGLFRLAGDPGERENLAAADAALAGRMRDLLRRAMSGALQPGAPSGDRAAEGHSQITEELEGQLQALGYVDRTGTD